MPRIPDRLRKLVLDNVELKVLSLILAVISWSAIQETISFERVIADVPIELVLNPGEAVQYQSENLARVTVRGTRNDVMALDAGVLHAIVNVAKSGFSKSGIIPIGPRNIEGTDRVRVLRVSPPAIRLEVTSEGEKRVPVEVMHIGEPDGGVVAGIECEPSEVAIRGPLLELREIFKVQTEVLDLRGRTRSISKRKVAIVPPSDRWEARFTPAQVEVTVLIEKTSLTRRWEGLPIQVVQRPGSRLQYVMIPEKADLSLTGHPDMLDPLRDGDVRILADLSEIRAGVTTNVPLFAYVPPGLEAAAQVDPATAQVVVKEQDTGPALDLLAPGARLTPPEGGGPSKGVPPPPDQPATRVERPGGATEGRN